VPITTVLIFVHYDVLRKKLAFFLSPFPFGSRTFLCFARLGPLFVDNSSRYLFFAPFVLEFLFYLFIFAFPFWTCTARHSKREFALECKNGRAEDEESGKLNQDYVASMNS
jgi:hypothetical protein